MPISKMSAMGKNRAERDLPSSIPLVWAIARFTVATVNSENILEAGRHPCCRRKMQFSP